MKTVVELKGDVSQSKLKAGDIGYIDGYVQARDGIGYAVVVVGEVVDYCPLYNLKVM